MGLRTLFGSQANVDRDYIEFDDHQEITGLDDLVDYADANIVTKPRFEIVSGQRWFNDHSTGEEIVTLTERIGGVLSDSQQVEIQKNWERNPEHKAWVNLYCKRRPSIHASNDSRWPWTAETTLMYKVILVPEGMERGIPVLKELSVKNWASGRCNIESNRLYSIYDPSIHLYDGTLKCDFRLEICELTALTAKEQRKYEEEERAKAEKERPYKVKFEDGKYVHSTT